MISQSDSLSELQEVVGGQMQYYPREAIHSSGGNRPPLAYLESEGFNPRQPFIN